jgi:hypothetical protein
MYVYRNANVDGAEAINVPQQSKIGNRAMALIVLLLTMQA